MLLFPTPYLKPSGGGGSGLAGYDTRIIRKSSATATAYGTAENWTLPVVAGELVVITMHAEGNAAVINPATFTLSLGGVAMTNLAGSATTGSGTFPGSAVFSLVAGITGTLALLAGTIVSARVCALVARRITGFDTTTPTGVHGGPSKLNTDALTLNGGALSVGRAGNVVIADACTKAGTATLASSTTLDGMGFDTTGGTTFTDLGLGFGHKLVAAPGSFTPDWTFDVSGLLSGAALEINVAP